MYRPGDKVGDYEIVTRIKSGGMAVLYLGRRSGAAGFSKPVAIKVVHTHLAEDEGFVTMFVDEANLSARIHHPNVVHVEELKEHEGAHYLVMEFVAGCSLRQLVKKLSKLRRRLAPEVAAHIAIKVLDGLHAAHELCDHDGSPLGVVHRDVSPDNVLLSWQGHVKLIDFGIAKAASRSTATQGKALKGKLRYMAPEQAVGGGVDRRSDIYALGILLWEMLTMQRLFSGETDLQILEQVRQPNTKPPSACVPGLPPGLDEVVLKALAADPTERFATAKDFRRALAKAVPGALIMESDVIAELLAIVMADEMDRQRQMESSPLAVPPALDAGAEGLLDNMTISVTDMGLSDSREIEPPSLPGTGGTSALSLTDRLRGSRWTVPAILGSAAVLAIGITAVVMAGPPEPTVETLGPRENPPAILEETLEAETPQPEAEPVVAAESDTGESTELEPSEADEPEEQVMGFGLEPELQPEAPAEPVSMMAASMTARSDERARERRRERRSAAAADSSAMMSASMMAGFATDFGF